MSVSPPPLIESPDFNRWLFLFYKSVSKPVVTSGQPTAQAGYVIAPNTPVTDGGTGASSLTGYVKGNGIEPFTASPKIPYKDLSDAPFLGDMASQSAGGVSIYGGTIANVPVAFIAANSALTAYKYYGAF